VIPPNIPCLSLIFTSKLCDCVFSTIISHHCLVRKWKSKTTLGADKKWEFEVGEDISMVSPLEASHIVESRSNVS
jgi:hypothetical protein